jgi:hypothetical protein
MKFLFLSIIFFALTLAHAQDEKPRAAIKTNGTIIYYDKIKDANSFLEMFSESNLYGRIRSNNFYFDWKNESDLKKDEFVAAIGGSVVMQSAKYADFDFLLGFYGSFADFDSSDGTSFFKSSKDTFSRYDYEKHGNRYMAVVAQANINYTGIDKTGIRLGRQLVETFYTKSNDTKMIPNTFDGGVITTKLIPDTTLKIAYLARQKLRDHTTNHSVLMYDDSNTDNYTKWDGNDDAGMHRGISYDKLKKNGKPTDSPLLILDFKNKSIQNLKIDGSVYNVPELLSQAMLEANYKFKFDGFSITPGLRYIRQFDDGAGSFAGASLSGKYEDTNSSSLPGYRTPNSLNAQMIAARIVAKIDDYKINLGYSNTLDEADLVNPWRGFPTAGYTRSMGVYNWRANTKSYRLELVRNPNKGAIYRDVFVQASVLYTDSDEKKEFIGNMNRSDYWYYYIGFVQNIPSIPELQWRLRLGYADFNDDSASKANYLDSRFELNYMF